MKLWMVLGVSVGEAHYVIAESTNDAIEVVREEMVGLDDKDLSAHEVAEEHGRKLMLRSNDGYFDSLAELAQCATSRRWLCAGELKQGR